MLRKKRVLTATVLWGIQLYASVSAAALTITPFQTANRSPLVQVFGLPPIESAVILGSSRSEGRLSLDIANNFVNKSNARESLLLDGESYRLNLLIRYGLGNNFEAGMELPFVGQGGGVFDSFIEGWHDFFGLPQGGRKDSPRNRLLYRYAKDGTVRLNVDDSGFGLGDIRLTGGYQLYHDGTPHPRAVALRGSLKLPTGSSGQLHGSGSTDTALWLTASADYGMPIGHITLMGAAGGMAMSRGDVITDQQRPVVGFASLGLGWAPSDWIAFIFQCYGHTPFYQGSSLDSLSASSLQLHSGGTLRLPGAVLLDIAVSEDIAVDTAPDVTLHVSLRRQF